MVPPKPARGGGGQWRAALPRPRAFIGRDSEAAPPQGGATAGGVDSPPPTLPSARCGPIRARLTTPKPPASQSERASHRTHRGHHNCPTHVTPPPIRPRLRGAGPLNQSARPSHGGQQQPARGQRAMAAEAPERRRSRGKAAGGKMAAKPRRRYLHVLVAELVDEHRDRVKRIVAVRRRHLRRRCRRRRPGSEGPYGAARLAPAGFRRADWLAPAFRRFSLVQGAVGQP